jgi:hypothetical protein
MLVLTDKKYEIEEDIILEGDNNKEISKFKMQITADEMQKIKDFIYDEYSNEKVKMINKLKRELKFEEADKIEEEIGKVKLENKEEFLKICLKENYNILKEKYNNYKMEEYTGVLMGFFMNIFAKQQISPINSLITDLQKITQTLK